MFKSIFNLAAIKQPLSIIIIPLILLLSACGGSDEEAELDLGDSSAPQNAKPLLIITSPDNGSAFSDGEQLTFTANANDPEDGDISEQINWSSNIDGALGAGASLNVSLSDGNHTITAKVEDSGQLSDSSSLGINVSITEIENTAPVILLVSPGNDSVFNSTDAITLLATASDNEDGNINARIQWQSDIDGDIGSGAQVTRSLSIGSHNITASVSDSANLTDQVSVLVNVEQTSSENNAPTVAITSPSNGTLANEGNSVQLTGTADDIEDGDLASQIQWISNLDGNIGSGNNINSQLSPGEHVIIARVMDSQNVTAESSINMVINHAPSINIIAPSSNSQGQQLDTISLVANASDAEDGNLNASIQWNSSIDGALGSGAELSLQLSSGNHTITATVTDSNGLSTSVSSSIEITQEQATGNASLTWTAPTENTDESTLDDLAGFVIYYGTNASDLSESIRIEDPTTYAWVIEELEAGNTYYFTVTAVNETGVESDPSQTVSKTIEG